jgi:hypothetical protein
MPIDTLTFMANVDDPNSGIWPGVGFDEEYGKRA